MITEDYDFPIRAMIHEAGHAVALLAYNLPFVYLSIIPEKNYLGKIQLSDENEPKREFKNEFPGAVDFMVLSFILAGTQAELVFIGNQNGGGLDDYASAYTYISKCLCADSEFFTIPESERYAAATEIIRGAEIICRALLKKHGKLIFEIARQLNDKKEIKYRDLRALADEYFQTLTNEV